MDTAVQPLVNALRDHAADLSILDLLDHHPTERSWQRVRSSADLELWLISWPPGSRTDWHDHGPAAGAFTVLRGGLVEHSWRGALRLHDLGPGDSRAFPAGYVHDVRNTAEVPALSLHAYSPRLETMTRYRFLGDRVEALGVEKAGESW
jgi:quercetin dioxygenase-like cupin family protein